MATIKKNGKTYDALASETVLDCLLRNGEEIKYSCMSGSCHCCLLKSSNKDALTAASQSGLSSEQINEGCFLSCQQETSKDIEII